MFITSAMVGLASKLLLLALGVLLTYFNVIENNGFLLLCYDLPTAEAKVNAEASQNHTWTMEFVPFQTVQQLDHVLPKLLTWVAVSLHKKSAYALLLKQKPRFKSGPF